MVVGDVSNLPNVGTDKRCDWNAHFHSLAFSQTRLQLTYLLFTPSLSHMTAPYQGQAWRIYLCLPVLILETEPVPTYDLTHIVSSLRRSLNYRFILYTIEHEFHIETRAACLIKDLCINCPAPLSRSYSLINLPKYPRHQFAPPPKRLRPGLSQP